MYSDQKFILREKESIYKYIYEIKSEKNESELFSIILRKYNFTFL